MIRKLSLIILLTFSIQIIHASHIVGGDFTNRWIGGNNFELTLKIYRDCINSQVPFDDSITIGIYNKTTNVRVDTLVMLLLDSNLVILSGPSASCLLPPEVCVYEGTYTDTINLPDNPEGYYISWERCCRNGAVVNIENAFNTGFTFYQEIPDPALQNSSPVFLNDPLPFVCEGQMLNYSFTATDVDGDSLVYELTDPLAANIGYPVGPPMALQITPMPGPYPSVLWESGYSLSNVCGSSVPLSINSQTGIISVTVDYIGIYGMAIIVHEFRNGIEIGLIRREIEFSVIICPNLPSVFTMLPLQSSPGINFSFNNISLYETDTLCFTIRVNDPTDSVFLSYSGNVFAGSGLQPPYATANMDSGFNQAVSNFCWNTACGHGQSSSYEVVFTSYDNGCPLPITVNDSIKITVKPVPIDSALNLICIGLRNNVSTELFWEGSITVPERFFSSYKIYRRKNNSPFSLFATISNSQAVSFADLTAANYLQDDYCYYITMVNSCGIESEPSDTLCTISQFNTKSVYLKQVSIIDSGKIELQWKHFPDGPYSTFYIYRKENTSGSSFTLYETLAFPNTDSWIDHHAAISDKSYCYYIVNEDYCGNIGSDGNEACSILLKGSAGASLSRLNWNSYTQWNGGVKNYELFKNSISDPLFSSLTVLADSIYFFRDVELDLDGGIFSYYVKAVEDTGSLNGESRSNEITLIQLPNGFLPSAFTPNNDGINDYFGVQSSFVREYEIKIFNRWGNLVFYSASKHQAWNGYYNDKPVQQGTYVYVAKITGYDDEAPHTRTGTVTLLR